MQKIFETDIQDIAVFMNGLDKLCKRFDVFSVLYSNNMDSPLHKDRYELLAGLGCKKVFSSGTDKAFDVLGQVAESKEWAFGYLSYELKDALWKTHPQPYSLVEQPSLFWFEPQYVLLMEKHSRTLQITGEQPQELYKEICDLAAEETTATAPLFQKALFTPVLSKNEYLQRVEQIRQDIEEGDYYEMNFCQEFVSEGFANSAYDIWRVLRTQNPTPFSAFFRNQAFYIVSASPERFLSKSGQILVSQPIKGTAGRLADKEADSKVFQALKVNPKERAENVMITDLVRNDLCRCCRTGSVQVEELCGVYSYPQVHQMISTVSGVLEKGKTVSETVQHTFPMGSMTGAPKKMVVERAAAYEPTRRGIYSGSLGYISPEGDFDLNVVIRSLLIDSQAEKASYHVGGAITYDSVPEQEYDECKVKAVFWKQLFG